MTITHTVYMTTATITSYEQALHLQSRLVQRAMLRPAQTHSIADELERPEFGSIWLTCSCGKHVSFKSDDLDRGEQLMVSHVLDAIRDTLTTAA